MIEQEEEVGRGEGLRGEGVLSRDLSVRVRGCGTGGSCVFVSIIRKVLKYAQGGHRQLSGLLRESCIITRL